MEIGKKDLFWNYSGTVMRVLSGFITMSLIIKLLPVEDIGLWGVFFSLESIIILLDFSFYTTISRNITYIFSGAQKLKTEGIDTIQEGAEINYNLLRGLLNTARAVYAYISGVMLVIFLTAGTLYINKVLIGYQGDIQMARTAWYLYGFLLCYRFFTFYYDALLVGRGFIKRSKQILVISQLTHLVTATALLLGGFGIISLVIGQTLSTIVNRALANRAFFDKTTRKGLHGVIPIPWRNIFKILWPNVYKSGFSSVSSVLLKNILPLIGGLYIPLNQIGYYSISKTIVDLTFTLALIWFMTYYPKMTGARSKGATGEVKRIFVKSQIIVIVIFAASAFVTLLYGNDILAFLKKDAKLLLAAPLLGLYFFASFLESMTYMSTQVILSTNRVPYYKSQFITAIVSVITLVLLLQFGSRQIAWLILVPFVTQLVYLHWRWFLYVVNELSLKLRDYIETAKTILKY